MNKAEKNIEDLKNAWLDKAKILYEEKCRIYGSMSMEEFLQLESDSSNKRENFNLKSLQVAFVELEEERQQLWIEEIVTEELNKVHAAMHTDQFYILTEKYDPIFGGTSFVLESKNSFRSFYENKIVTCPDGRRRTKADIWLKHPLRREYKGINFDPTNKQSKDNNLYNIWKGFSKTSKKGNIDSYWNHVKDNICSKDPVVYKYVRKWIASVFQFPSRVHTALILCGSQGVGKNGFVDPLGVLLGQHYAPLGNVSELISNFNFHLKNAVLIHANEAFWGGAKKEIGTLKAMITEETCLIEAKGKDRILVKNYKHVIMSSNEDWPVSLDPDDRRFFVTKVSEDHKEDHGYFKKIKDDLEDGGYEALLHDLLTEDLSDFNPRVFPISPKAFDIKLQSATSTHSYVYESLLEGNVFVGDGETKNKDWPMATPKTEIYKNYITWCQSNGYKSEAHNKFTMILKKLIPSVSEARKGKRNHSVRVHVFPKLVQARREFCNAFKETGRIWSV